MQAPRTFTIAFLLLTVVAQRPGDKNEMDMYKKAKPAPLNDDLPYIKCATCERMTVEALKQVKALVDAEKPTKVAHKRRFESSSNLGGLEEGVEDILTKICDPENDGGKEYNKPARSSAGKWLAQLDIAKDRNDRSYLTLYHKGEGHCRRECRTIAKSCEQVLEKMNANEDDDLAEYLLAAAREGLSAGTVQQRVCTKMSGLCKRAKMPLWPGGKARMDETFKPKTAEDIRLETMAATMPGEHGTGITIMKPGDYDLPDSKPAKLDEIDVLKEEL